MDDESDAPSEDVSVPGAFGPGPGGAGALGSRDGRLEPVRHRPWSTILLVLHALPVPVAATVLVLGVVGYVAYLGAPRPEEGEPSEPWGLLGIFFAVAALCVLALTATLTVATHRGRRQADAGSRGTLQGVAIMTLVIAGIALVPSLASVRADDVGSLTTWLVLAGPYTACAILLLVTTRSPRA